MLEIETVYQNWVLDDQTVGFDLLNRKKEKVKLTCFKLKTD